MDIPIGSLLLRQSCLAWLWIRKIHSLLSNGIYFQSPSFLHQVTKHFAETVHHQLMEEDPPAMPLEGRRSRDQSSRWRLQQEKHLIVVALSWVVGRWQPAPSPGGPIGSFSLCLSSPLAQCWSLVTAQQVRPWPSPPWVASPYVPLSSWF